MVATHDKIRSLIFHERSEKDAKTVRRILLEISGNKIDSVEHDNEVSEEQKCAWTRGGENVFSTHTAVVSIQDSVIAQRVVTRYSIRIYISAAVLTKSLIIQVGEGVHRIPLFVL